MTRKFSILPCAVQRGKREMMEPGQGPPPCCHGPGRGKLP